MSPGSSSTGSRLMVATAAPVTMLVAPGPIEVVQASVCRRLFIFAKAAAVCTIACSLRALVVAAARRAVRAAPGRCRRRCRGRRCRTRRRRTAARRRRARCAAATGSDHGLRHRQAGVDRVAVISLLPSRCDERLHLGQRRHEVGAAVAGDDDGAGGVAHADGALERPSLQPAVEQAARERVARAEHVQHVDRNGGTSPGAAGPAGRMRAARAALQHQRVDARSQSAARSPPRRPACRWPPRLLLRCRPPASPCAAASAPAPRTPPGCPLAGAVVDVDDDRRAGVARGSAAANVAVRPARGSARCR